MYIDPNFGSMIIQLIVALIAGCGAYIIMARKKLSMIVSSKKQSKEELAQNPDEEVKNEN